MFQQDYISAMMDLGFRDAESRLDELNSFFNDD